MHSSECCHYVYFFLRRRPLPCLCFSGRSVNKDCNRAYDWPKLFRKQVIDVLYKFEFLSSTGRRPVELMRYPVVLRDIFMVTFCWPHGLVVYVQFLSSPDPWGPTVGLCPFFFLSMCLRGLIVVLFCRIHDLDVQCASLVQSNYPGAQKGT